MCGMVLVAASVHWIGEGPAPAFLAPSGKRWPRFGGGGGFGQHFGEGHFGGIAVGGNSPRLLSHPQGAPLLCPPTVCGSWFLLRFGLSSGKTIACIWKSVFCSGPRASSKTRHDVCLHVIPGSHLSAPYSFIIILLPPPRMPGTYLSQNATPAVRLRP